MTPFIHQANPGAAYLEQKEAIDAAIARVLGSGWYVLGDEVRAFETEFAAFAEAANAVTVASGTDAIELALRALGIGPGDLVFTVSHTAVPTGPGPPSRSRPWSRLSPGPGPAWEPTPATPNCART